MRRQGSQVSMRVARGSASWLSSHGVLGGNRAQTVRVHEAALPWTSPCRGQHFTRRCTGIWGSAESLRPHGLYVAYQAPPSMRFSRQEYWSGVPLPSLEEISSLFHSIVFLYFFVLIAEEGSFLFSFAFRFSSFHSYL